jgi:hypothetical protein
MMYVGRTTIPRSPNLAITCCSHWTLATPYASDPSSGSVAALRTGRASSAPALQVRVIDPRRRREHVPPDVVFQ